MTKVQIVNEAYATPFWWWGWIIAGTSWMLVILTGAWLGLLVGGVN